MIDSPKVSVIIPVYNVERYIKQALDSVIHQTYKNLEILVVDDGSTDQSGAICDAYLKKDARICVVHTVNRGQAVARNSALKLATGKYIFFLDSDDYVQLNYIEEMVGACEHFGAKMAISSIEMRYGVCTRKYSYFQGEKIFSSAQELIEEYLTTPHIGSMICNKFFTAELFETLRFPECRANEDYAILHRLFDKAGGAVYVDKVYYTINRRPDSTEGKSFNKNKLYLLEAESDLQGFVKSNYPELSEAVRYRKANAISFLMESIIASGEWKKEKVLLDNLCTQLKEECDLISWQIGPDDEKIRRIRISIDKPKMYWVMCYLKGFNYRLKNHILRLLIVLENFEGRR